MITKTMSKRYFFLPILLLVLASVITVGCKRDKCKRVVCENGECVDGTCVCEVGYGGADCSSALNMRFDGNYDLTEQCTAGSDAYTLYFKPSTTNKSQFLIAGLWDSPNDTLVATVDANGTDLTIERQGFAGVELEGEGNINMTGSTGTITYRVYQPGNGSAFDVCSAEFESQ